MSVQYEDKGKFITVPAQQWVRNGKTKKELDAAAIAGAGAGDANERAAWTVVARALLNLDETITKE